jgi:hypothetical protein
MFIFICISQRDILANKSSSHFIFNVSKADFALILYFSEDIGLFIFNGGQWIWKTIMTHAIMRRRYIHIQRALNFLLNYQNYVLLNHVLELHIIILMLNLTHYKSTGLTILNMGFILNWE